MYDAWKSAMQKGIGAAFQRSNTDSGFDGDSDNKISSPISSEANGGVVAKNNKMKKVR